MNRFSIRRAKSSEMKVFVELASAEGWNPGLRDAECFYSADPSGFFVGTLGEEIVGIISAVSYEGGYGFIGFFIVRPKFRNKGYGLKLWERALEYLEGYSIGLDGVPSQQINYEKSGFQSWHHNIRWLGKTTEETELAKGVVRIDEINPELLYEFDHKVFGFDRKTFLSRWISAPEHVGFAKIAKNKLSGYGIIRPCGTCWKIGPLFAKKQKTARQILSALCGTIPADSECYLDTPTANEGAIELATSLGMKKIFETVRMYRGAAPKIKYSRWFSVSSFELG